MKDSSNGRLFLFFISKEYNINSLDVVTYKAGRFVFAPLTHEPVFEPTIDALLLAEEPAQAFTNENFQVESYYL